MKWNGLDWTARLWAALLAGLAFSTPCAVGADSVIISEFLASNSNGLADEDGDTPDWIELLNTGTNVVNLDGWILTDSANRWRLPSTNLSPSAFLVVFASGKDRAIPGPPLHANFSLSAGGEYLALLRPDGVSIASEFEPLEQFPNVSYGVAQDLQVTKLVSNTGPVRFYISTNNTLATNWMSPAFDDSGWRAGTNGIGYETYVPGFAIKNIRTANMSVCDLSTADGVLATPAQQAAVFTETRAVINYLNTGSGANFPNDFTFPGFTINVDQDHFVTEATGILTIPSSGNWTFGVNSDDGFRVTIGANIMSFPSPRGPGDTFATFNLAAGEYPVRLVFYECNGGSEVEFFAAAGTYSAFNASFRLVGDTAGGGLAVKSLPVTSRGSLRSEIATDVQSLIYLRAGSTQIRIPFGVADPSVFSSLTLRMKYDDGFIAYLNGTEIARRNVPATVQWSSLALTNRASTNSLAFEDIDITSRLSLLQAGSNLLAIHGLNDSPGSSDFLIQAELVENKVLGTTNHYFATPSPGTANGSGFFAFVDNLDFTPERGWFDNTNFLVTIASATPGTSIRYTTNGTPPTTTNGLIYTDGIFVGGTTLIRAIGYRSGFEPTKVETHSYIFLNQVQAQSTNGNWVGGSSGDYTLTTNITQNALYRDMFKSDLLSIPTLSIVMKWDDAFGPSGVWSNPQAEGVAWERPCSLEYMRPDGKKGFDVNCGIRIQGGASRNLVSKHGLRVLFKNIYGPGKLDYPLYPDSPVQEFDTLTLHATFNDHWLWGGAAAQMQRDQWCRDAQNAMGGYGPHGTYVHLYLNGLYWGLYNIGEKGDASYAAHYLGGEKEEYDAFNSDELIDGNRTAWDQMFAIANAGITTDAAYTNLSQYLNVPNFIDYMLMNFYAVTTDWPWHNWNAARRRVPGAGFHFFSWDAEWTFGIGAGVGTDRTGETAGAPGILYTALRAHPEFRMQFGDHAQKHLFNGGALTPAVAQARWMQRAAEIDRAVVGESARWGAGYTRQTWLNAQASVLSWFPQRGGILIPQLRNAGLFPQLDAPIFAQHGGLVPPGFSLSITNPNGSGAIYFTLDGADPRVWGGALNTSARLYSTPLALTNALFIRARVRDGTNWSALVEATFYVVQDFSALKVTEIMYRPPNLAFFDGDEVEFIELKNTGTNILDLSGLQFTDGITFAFTNGTRLAPGAFFLLARNAQVFASKYPGVTINGIYTGRLDNGGEQITLAHILGTNVFSFSYDDDVPWPITPDGYGFSLVRANINGDPSMANSWRPSANLAGSPGVDDPSFTIPGILINEILSRTNGLQSIELYNPSATAVDIGGWFLSDEPTQPKKFRISSPRTIAPGGFTVFTESDFNPQPGVPPSFDLNSHGGSLFLFSGDAITNLTGYSHSVEYGAAANGVSFGRYVVSTGEEQWPAMQSSTYGTSNSAPRVGPLVINEIMYHPAIGYDEFVELHNFGSTSVSLFDPTYPTNRWRLSGLGYTFSNNISVPAGGYLLLVPIDAAQFRTKYGVSPAVQIVGPYSGVLQDSGERLRIERPDTPDTNGVPYVVVDEVRYNDKLPWPQGADGDGPSLQRRTPFAYGNEPTNWFASGATPGGVNSLNQPPICVLNSPTNGATFTVPINLTLGASATDPDGTIARVEFYGGTVLLGLVTNAPFTFVWSNVPMGAHAIVAKARDNRLAVAPSATINIIVNPPPVGTGLGLRADYYDNIDFTGTRVRRLDSTVNFDWGTGSPDAAIGADSFSARWIGQVQPRFTETYTFHTVSDDGVRLWVNNQLIVDSWVDQSPTEHSGFIPLQAGQMYDIKMDFYENGGGAAAQLFWSAPSVPREVIPATQLYPPSGSNVAPSVVLATPSTGAVFVANSPITITANASDLDGAVYKVEFYATGSKLGEDTTSPFALVWTNAAAGSYALRAVVTDDSGLSRTSAPVDITVLSGYTSNFTFISTGAVWKYLDNGSDPVSEWKTIAFNDSGWSNGPAQLGYGDGDERTVVGYGPNASTKYITTYFRRSFNLTDPAAFTSLSLRVLRDDGAVIYLNGSEVFRDNMPSGPVNYLTPSSSNVGGLDETVNFYAGAINPGYLVVGTNVIAAEVHQSSGASSDLSFDFDLVGVQSFVAPYITTQPQNQTVPSGTTANLSVGAQGTSPLKYQWRLNGTNLIGGTNNLLVLPLVAPQDAGNYLVVVTNRIGSVTSQVAVLDVVMADTDSDGMPDWWENAHHLNPGDASDALGDRDGDGMVNRDEFLAGTDPEDAGSALRIEILATNGITLRFFAQSNIAYIVEFQTNITAIDWQLLRNIAPQPLSRIIDVTDPAASNSPTCIYRIVSPTSP